MRVLIIKTSSMGDILHTLPALTDAAKNYPDIQFDWVVEENFSEIPLWHPKVNRVIPIAFRRWRKQPLKAISSGEWKNFYHHLRAEKYDAVIDAQGLVKSAFITRLARGKRCGLNRHSAWEPLATLAYQQTCAVKPDQHAVARVRQLFAAILKYPVPTDTPDYGIDQARLQTVSYAESANKENIIFLHGTTWPTKHWPETYWIELAQQITRAGFQIQIPWGNQPEYERAQRISAGNKDIYILPKLNLNEIASVLKNAKAAVAVDTGLGHLAAALAVPTLSLYGPTDAKLTGAMGVNQLHLAAQFPCAPCLKSTCTYQGPRNVEPACFGSLPPTLVWENFKRLL